jgi:predicted SnoaL-like aldol condensation-catalyzing enzyme
MEFIMVKLSQPLTAAASPTVLPAASPACAKPTGAIMEIVMQQFSPSQNKAIVIEAFDTLFNRRDTQKAKRFWSPDYIQHSALVPAGRDGLFSTIMNAPEMQYEHKLAVSEGDFVMIHGRFSHIGQAANWIVVDICRLQDGVLVEHWDVIQDEVGQAASAGGHPMFGSAFPSIASPTTSATGQVSREGA